MCSSAHSLSSPRVELLFKGTLEESQTRKLDHLIARANVQKEDRVLDLGFGWGGLSLRLAETVGCRVHGITLSKEQHDLALERVRARGPTTAASVSTAISGFVRASAVLKTKQGYTSSASATSSATKKMSPPPLAFAAASAALPIDVDAVLDRFEAMEKEEEKRRIRS